MGRWIAIAAGALALVVGGCDQPKPAPKAPAPKPAVKPVATWTLIRETGGYAFYVTQPETVGEMKRMWLASIGSKTAKDGAGRQSNALFEIDCKENRVRYLQEDEYDQDGHPMAVKPIEDPAKWYYPNPDVVARRVVDMGCGRMPIVGEGFDSLKDARKADAPKPKAGA